MRDENNPIVLLSGDQWHIVDDSRQSTLARCGQPIRQRRAHSRLKTIGLENLCPKCRVLVEEQ